MNFRTPECSLKTAANSVVLGIMHNDKRTYLNVSFIWIHLNFMHRNMRAKALNYRVHLICKTLPTRRQCGAPLRVSMAIPHDVIAEGDSGIEGDTRSARRRVQLRYSGRVNPVMWNYALREKGIFYWLFCCSSASTRTFIDPQCCNVAAQLLPTSCGRQQPDGRRGGGGGCYIKSAAVRWTTLALLLAFRLLTLTDPNSNHVSLLGIRSQQRWGVQTSAPSCKHEWEHWRTIRGFFSPLFSLCFYLFYFFWLVKHISITGGLLVHLQHNQAYPDILIVVFHHPSSFIGPDKWADGFPVANGPRQSPIDIVPGDAAYDAGMKPLRLKYDPSTSLEILNNGHSFQVTFADESDSSS